MKKATKNVPYAYSGRRDGDKVVAENGDIFNVVGESGAICQQKDLKQVRLPWSWNFGDGPESIKIPIEERVHDE